MHRLTKAEEEIQRLLKRVIKVINGFEREDKVGLLMYAITYLLIRTTNSLAEGIGVITLLRRTLLEAVDDEVKKYMDFMEQNV